LCLSSRRVVQDDRSADGKDCFEHEDANCHGLNVTIRLITQLVQGMGELNVQKQGYVGQSTDATVGWDGATLGHFDNILNQGWIATTIGSCNTIGLRLQS